MEQSEGKVARRGREYDGYAVGRRVVRMAPLWLLLLVTGFGLVLLLFSWAARPAGDDFKNEATNRAPADEARPPGAGSKTPASGAGRAALVVTPPPAPTPAAQGQGGGGEAGDYSVQVGAFADLSQANEQVSRLRAAGFEAGVVESEAGTRFRFRVRSGRFRSREEAARQASRLRAAGAAGESVIVGPERE